MYAGATSAKFRDSLQCEDCLTIEHYDTKCPFRGNIASPETKTLSPRGDGVISPRRNERIDQALANPEKSAKKPSEGIQLKYAFG